METRNYWNGSGHAVKYENYSSSDGYGRAPGCSDQLNFAAVPSEDEGDYQAGYLKKGKVPRQDPMSHRIIEKRRRDRMNNCLADLSRLIPPEYLKKGRGRVEKTEIIEMAIRHLKYLQDRANGLYNTHDDKIDYVPERQMAADAAEHYRAGFQEAVSEAVRFLVEVQGFGPSDGLCVQLSSHLQRHCEHRTKGADVTVHNSHQQQNGNTSETNSSSSSSQGYAMKQSVIARASPPSQPEPSRYTEPYDAVSQDDYQMACDRMPLNPIRMVVEDGEVTPSSDEPLPLDSYKRDSTLRTVRKPDHGEDYLHSYKFKNSIERGFSRSQDCEAHDMSLRTAHGKTYTHKRRRAAKPIPESTSTSNSGSTEDARDTSPQDTSSESLHHHYEKTSVPPSQYIPIFALNVIGKYYVPLSIDYACLSRHLGPFNALVGTQAAAPLHPVTIHVNFQPCVNYHVKRELHDKEWAAA